MLRSRDKTAGKTDSQPNGAHIAESNKGSAFTISGIVVCVLFSVVVIYFVFFGTSNNDTSLASTHSSLSSKLNAAADAFTSPEGQQALRDTAKALSDVSVKEHNKLTRFMHEHAHQHHHHPKRMNQLNQLTNNEYTKEITFTLQADALPRDRDGKRLPTIFIRQAFPLKQASNEMHKHNFVLIFLHGASYSSATWSELGILSSLARQGYISYALDVPGFGKSVNTVAKDNQWLKQIIQQLVGNDEMAQKQIESAGGIATPRKKIVLVTASMSGKYVIPLLFEPPGPMIGMITIAPVGTDKYKKDEYRKVSVPVCIVYGEQDRKLGEESKQNLVQIPNHKLIMVPNGQHAAYKTDPRFFHSVVVKWLTENFDD